MNGKHLFFLSDLDPVISDKSNECSTNVPEHIGERKIAASNKCFTPSAGELKTGSTCC